MKRIWALLAALGMLLSAEAASADTLVGFVADATMNAILVEDERGGRFAFSKSAETDMSGLENGLMLGNCVEITYGGSLDREGEDASGAALLAVADGFAPEGAGRISFVLSLEGMAEEIRLARLNAEGFSVWYDSDSFRPEYGQGVWALSARAAGASARLRFAAAEENALSLWASALATEGFASADSDVRRAVGGREAEFLYMTNAAGDTRAAALVETERGGRYLAEIGFAAEEAEGLGERLWSALSTFRAQSVDGRSEATIYVADDNCERLVALAATAVATPQGLMDALYAAGALPERVAARGLSIDGDGARLDLSANFGALMSSTGTAGERMYMGAIVNTFLTAYGLSEITVTSAGAVIETGHSIYDTPLAFFSDDI